MMCNINVTPANKAHLACALLCTSLAKRSTMIISKQQKGLNI